jgi:hypothetical protein
LALVTALSILLGVGTAVYRWHVEKLKREAANAWIVELRGYTYHTDAANWWIELESRQSNAPTKFDLVEAHYYDNLRPVFEQLEKQQP